MNFNSKLIVLLCNCWCSFSKFIWFSFQFHYLLVFSALSEQALLWITIFRIDTAIFNDQIKKPMPLASRPLDSHSDLLLFILGSIAFFAGFNSKRAASAASRQDTYRKIHIVACYWRSRGLLLLSIALLARSFSAACLIFQPSCTTSCPSSVDQPALTYSAFGSWRTRSALPHLIGQCWILLAVNLSQVPKFSNSIHNAILNSIFQ